MVRFTLKQCTYFLAVVERGGIAQAARSLNISQPAVAQAIDKLEEMYGFRLLQRHHARGTEVTPEGRSFAAKATRLLALADEVEHDAAAIAAHLAGQIRFGCFHTIAPFYLAQLVQTYQARHAQIDIVASELAQDQIIEKLESNALDLALTYDMGLNSDHLGWQVVNALAPFVLLRADHRLAAQAHLKLSELAQEPFVMFEGASSQQYFESVLGEHNIDPPVAFRSSSMEGVRCAVANGLGFSLSVMRPRHDATYDGGQVVAVPIADHAKPIALVLAHKKDRPVSGLIDGFETFCLSELRAAAP